jgi:Putative membrane protein insertion efficiency factor
MRHWVVLIWFTVLLTYALAGVAGAADKLRGPWPQSAPEASPADGPETSVPGLAVRGALTAWRNVLTRADGPRSVMYPTASGFLGQAVAKHGMLIGIMMTTDRLLHEWDEQQRAPRIVKYGISRAYDPVEANDFWWARDAE